MAINQQDKAIIITQTTDVNTKESQFRTGIDHVIDQVDLTQTHMDAARTIRLVGDVTGTMTIPDTDTYSLNNADHYAITITTTYNTTDGNQLDASSVLVDGSITTAKIRDDSITTVKILDGAVTTQKIPSASRRALIIQDENGTQLFRTDGLVPL